MTNLDWLTYVAKRSSTEHGLLGQVFATYQSIEDCTRDALAEELGCDEQTLDKLSLCRRPSGDAFAEQVNLICSRFRLDSSSLVNVLRQVEIMSDDAPPVARDISGHSAAQLQLAARDRRKKDEPTS